MSSLVDELRASRKSPTVLKLKVLKIMGEDPNILIFIYEGPDDVPVYEEWMRRIADCPRYEPLPGAGKQQLLAYHKTLVEGNDPALDRIFFFIDRDFDLPSPPHDNIFELQSYSIENLLCTEEVLDSILRDEFRKAGALAERKTVLDKFVELRTQFLECCNSINFILFAAQRKSISVLKKPEKISEVVHIRVDSIQRAFENIEEVVSIAAEIPPEELSALSDEFDRLPPPLRERGKYVLEMFRRWIRTLSEDVKQPRPILFHEGNDRLPGDPSSASLRRFASSASLPEGLPQFISATQPR